METSITLIIGLLGIAASLMPTKPRLQNVLFALAGIAVLWTSRVGLDAADAAPFILSLLSGTVLIGLSAGFILKKYAQWLALAGTLLSMLFLSETITYFGFEIVFSPKIALMPFFGGLIPIIAAFKGKLIQKWFYAPAAAVAKGASAFIAGLLVFYAVYFAQYFGVLLIGAGWLSVALARQYEGQIASSFGFLGLGFLFLLMKTNPAIDASFLHGNFLMGLVIGGAAVSWVLAAKSMNRFTWVSVFIVPLLIVLAAVLLGKINLNFGGVPAYAGALLGAGLLVFTKRNDAFVVPLYIILIGLSSCVIPVFAVQQEAVKKSRIDKTQSVTVPGKPEPDALAITAVPLSSDLEGTWKSVSEKSTLAFKLGPEGNVTTGIFKTFDVTLRLNSNGEPDKIDLKMASNALSTFDAARDEHLYSADFLNTAKYPLIIYKSKSIQKENDRYFVTGEFTMMGVKQPISLEIKFAAAGMEKSRQYLVMVGKSSLDRTKFGMESDSALGNVVDVNFEIEFRK